MDLSPQGARGRQRRPPLRHAGRGAAGRDRADHGDPRPRRARLPPVGVGGRHGERPRRAERPLMGGFLPLGALALVAGLAVLAAGLRSPAGLPRRAALLIGGMMLTALGLLLGGFAIAYETAPPLDLNAGAAR